MGVGGKETAQAVGVIPVAVGQHGEVRPVQIHAQLGGVVCELARSSGIQKDGLLPCFDPEGQTVLRRKGAAGGGGIFH